MIGGYGLRRCPYCGEPPEEADGAVCVRKVQAEKGMRWTAWCPDCGAETPEELSARDAIKRWNTGVIYDGREREC